MNDWRKIAPALLAVMAAGVLWAACGSGGTDDGGSDDGGANDPTAAVTQTAATNTEPPAEAGTAGPVATATAGVVASDLEELREVRERFIASTFSATYENRGPAVTEFVPVRIFKNSQERYRVDFVGEREGQPYSGSSIIDRGTAYTCGTGELAVLIGGNEAGACVSDPGGTASPLEALFAAFDVDDDVRLTQREERQVAGRTAQCYTTLQVSSGAAGTLCVDAGGALLAIESADPSGTNIIATTVSDTVTDADFVPPYEVREVPAQ